jgi:hypothetical protein
LVIKQHALAQKNGGPKALHLFQYLCELKLRNA